MAPLRTPLQGVLNIVRFNWHFYLLAVVGGCILLVLAAWLPTSLALLLVVLFCAGAFVTLLSLVVSWYIYDFSGLYALTWLHTIAPAPGQTLLNIHAGFDETSALLHDRYPEANFRVFDFYDPAKHTEISIRRARNAYPSYSGTVAVTTARLPLDAESVDVIFLIFAAHEIRNDAERAQFFECLSSSLKPNGTLVVTEHLRDTANFVAYTFGVFHFLPRKVWAKTFRAAHLSVKHETKYTPFVTTFILQKHDPASSK